MNHMLCCSSTSRALSVKTYALVVGVGVVMEVVEVLVLVEVGLLLVLVKVMTVVCAFSRPSQRTCCWPVSVRTRR